MRYNRFLLPRELLRLTFASLLIVLSSGAGFGQPSMKDWDLSGANFSSRNLDGADYSGAILRGASFRDATLRRRNLQHADLRGTDFSNADLTGATLKGAIGPVILHNVKVHTVGEISLCSELWILIVQLSEHFDRQT